MAHDSRAVLDDAMFRRESSRLVSALTRLLGPRNVALAEDVVQDTLVRALEAWQLGLPDEPRAWLLTTARNKAIDILRRERRMAPESEASILEDIESALAPDAAETN